MPGGALSLRRLPGPTSLVLPMELLRVCSGTIGVVGAGVALWDCCGFSKSTVVGRKLRPLSQSFSICFPRWASGHRRGRQCFYYTAEFTYRAAWKLDMMGGQLASMPDSGKFVCY